MKYTIGTDDPYVAEILVVLVEWLDTHKGDDPRFSVPPVLAILVSEAINLVRSLTPEQMCERLDDWLNIQNWLMEIVMTVEAKRPENAQPKSTASTSH